MKQFAFICLLLVPTTVGVVARPTLAQNSAGILDHYRLLPRYSKLHETGGFAGFDRSYRLTGKYDLLHGADWNSRASFENAEVWGSIISNAPVATVVIDVDKTLNLEGLKGEQLPVAAPFDVYRFTGKMADESSVDLFASVIGPWMYLRGGTQPPPGSADFFTYHIRALARSPRPFADLNDDGIVDAADYIVHRKSADYANVDIANYTDWVQQFGETVPNIDAMDVMMSTALVSYAQTATVPEPASLGLVLAGGLVLICLRRR